MEMDRRQFALATLPLAAVAVSGQAAAAVTPEKPLTEWYYADAILMPHDTTPETAWLDVTGESTDWLSIFNLTDQPATASVTRFFEEMEPKSREHKLSPLATTIISGQDLPEADVPKSKLHGVRVQTSAPAVVQIVRAEHQMVGTKPGILPGNTFLSRMAYPGPIGKRETIWGFGNGFIEHHRDGKGWEETERVTILNPNPDKPAEVKFIFCYPNARFTHDCAVAPQRVQTVNFMTLPFLREARGYGLIVRSDVPVIAEQVRRGFIHFARQPLGGWIVPGYPLGDAGIALPS